MTDSDRVAMAECYIFLKQMLGMIVHICIARSIEMVLNVNDETAAFSGFRQGRLSFEIKPYPKGRRNHENNLL
ncbi:MAG: hypothetical protein Q9M08_08150 [Mariprofundus sp.]|nr:hypothetical protein [Mariprofundus sp.]